MMAAADEHKTIEEGRIFLTRALAMDRHHASFIDDTSEQISSMHAVSADEVATSADLRKYRG